MQGTLFGIGLKTGYNCIRGLRTALRYVSSTRTIGVSTSSTKLSVQSGIRGLLV